MSIAVMLGGVCVSVAEPKSHSLKTNESAEACDLEDLDLGDRRIFSAWYQHDKNLHTLTSYCISGRKQYLLCG